MKNPAPAQIHDKSIKQHINQLILIVSGTMAVIIVLIIMLIYMNIQYDRALLCANTAAQFNKEFKSNIDHQMYNHVIQPRSESSEDSLPAEELDHAEDVLERLENTTTLPDNRWRVRSMLDMCRNLRMYMTQIAQMPSYDQRMELLERNIRGETGLTELIENYMHDFLDDEVKELARISKNLRFQSIILIIAAITISAALAVWMVINSIKTSRSITEPVRLLSSKADQFGSGDFDGVPVKSNITELNTLDKNFDKMAERINALMEKQRENQESLHRAELELLQAQINPHFLYNTLDSIAILAESQREDDVIAMVNSLSVFFRNSLNNGQDIISLGAELAQASSYLEIQQIRYSDILDYTIHVPDEILDIQVPKLILQPLIENALYHGIKNRRGRGLIRITGMQNGSDILIKIEDNGTGIDPERLKLLKEGIYSNDDHAMGLKNVNQRIRLYCGEEFGLSFNSCKGLGTSVTIRLPGSGIDAGKEVSSK